MTELLYKGETQEMRVMRGAAWLDDHMPGWWEAIDLEMFTIGDCNQCVFGQLTNGYSNRPVEFQDEANADADLLHGFMFIRRPDVDIEDGHLEDAVHEDVDALDEAWRSLIEARRQAAPKLDLLVTR